MKKNLFVVLLSFVSYFTIAQNVGINNSGNVPDNSAGLDVNFSDKGVLFPRLTTIDRNAIQNPANSLMIFNTTTECVEIYNAGKSSWMKFGCFWNCGSSFVDSRDNSHYKTVQIGNQCWMAENLAYLPAVSPASSGSTTDPHYYVYGYNGTVVNTAKTQSNYLAYGVLYNWTAATDGSSSSNPGNNIQGACPAGWHLPSDAEWQELEMNVGLPPAIVINTGWRGTSEGIGLKTTVWNGDNNSGFSALPGGWRVTEGTFNNLSSYGLWWSATETTENGSTAWRRYLRNTHNGIYRIGDNKGRGLSVRCIKD